MVKKGLIFDIDGVLVDVQRSFVEATKKTIYDFSNKRISSSAIMKMKNTPGFNDDIDLIYAVVKNWKKVGKNERKTRDYVSMRQRFDEIYWGTQKTAGTKKYERHIIRKSTLRRLASKYKLGIVTGRTRRETDWALRGMRAYFKQAAIITSDDTNYRKPSPAPLILARKRLGVKNALYVGDTVNDFLAAKRAKFPYIHIGNSVPSAQKISDVNQLLETVGDKI